MPEPATSNDHIERANAQFWTPPSLEELMADIAPLDADEDFDIPDVTDKEWDVFVAALNGAPLTSDRTRTRPTG